MTIVVFHYHLLPGGVTSVIYQTVCALATHMPDAGDVHLVSGRADGMVALTKRLAASVAGRMKLTFSVHPQIDYVAHPDDRADMRRRTDAIVALLTTNHLDSDSIWWVHNHHLGKNPAFTAALSHIARQHPDQRMILQIHDFPECARYKDYRVQRAFLGDACYPQHPAIAYTLINGRDARLLAQAGIDETRIFVLPNTIDGAPVPVSTATASPRDQQARLRQRLTNHFGNEYGTLDQAAPLALYPVRTIRRKNALEAALVCLIGASVTDTDAGEPAANVCPFNLIVTLPGLSPAERPYSDFVHDAFRQGIIPGLWGIGNTLAHAGIEYHQLIAGADVILSSSVQEGFGFAFFEALRAGKPLVARWLDILTDYEPLLRSGDPLLYTGIDIDLDHPIATQWRTTLRDDYARWLCTIAEYLVPETHRILRHQVETLLSQPRIDFSYLRPDMQIEILRTMHDPEYRTAIGMLNPQIPIALRNALAHPQRRHDKTRLQHTLGSHGFCSRVQRIFDIISQPHDTPCRIVNGIQRHLEQCFAKIDYLRPLNDI